MPCQNRNWLVMSGLLLVDIALCPETDRNCSEVDSFQKAVPKPGELKSTTSLVMLSNRYRIAYSVRKLFTGFIRAALMLWKLTVSKAMNTVSKPASANNHQDKSMR